MKYLNSEAADPYSVGATVTHVFLGLTGCGLDGADHAAAIKSVAFEMTEAFPNFRMALEAAEIKRKSCVVTDAPHHQNIRATAVADAPDYVDRFFLLFLHFHRVDK